MRRTCTVRSWWAAVGAQGVGEVLRNGSDICRRTAFDCVQHRRHAYLPLFTVWCLCFSLAQLHTLTHVTHGLEVLPMLQSIKDQRHECICVIIRTHTHMVNQFIDFIACHHNNHNYHNNHNNQYTPSLSHSAPQSLRHRICCRTNWQYFSLASQTFLQERLPPDACSIHTAITSCKDSSSPAETKEFPATCTVPFCFPLLQQLFFQFADLVDKWNRCLEMHIECPRIICIAPQHEAHGSMRKHGVSDVTAIRGLWTKAILFFRQMPVQSLATDATGFGATLAAAQGRNLSQDWIAVGMGMTWHVSIFIAHCALCCESETTSLPLLVACYSWLLLVAPGCWAGQLGVTCRLASRTVAVGQPLWNCQASENADWLLCRISGFEFNLRRVVAGHLPSCSPFKDPGHAMQNWK